PYQFGIETGLQAVRKPLDRASLVNRTTGGEVDTRPQKKDLKSGGTNTCKLSSLAPNRVHQVETAPKTGSMNGCRRNTLVALLDLQDSRNDHIHATKVPARHHVDLFDHFIRDIGTESMM